MNPVLRSLVRHEEPLNSDELAFLRRKEGKDRSQLYRVCRVFMILCFICPFLVACVRAIMGAEDPFNYGSYFAGVGFLMVFSGAGLYAGYYKFLRKVQQDIRRGTKTIERSLITRKQYMPHNNTYFFYINSPHRLSIEVAEFDYHNMHLGDEVNIEYTTMAKMYLGYY